MTWSACAASAFAHPHWHNEMLNIWTHVAAVVLFALVYAGFEWQPMTLPGERLVIHAAMVGKMACYATSVVYHTCYPRGGDVYMRLLRCDAFGVALDVITSGLVAGYYFFIEHDMAFTASMAVKAVVVVPALAVVVYEGASMSQKRWVMPLFAASGVVAFFPTVVSTIDYAGGFWAEHSSALLTPELQRHTLGVAWMSGAFYAAGFSVYVLRIPERFYQSAWIDALSGSHALWHVLAFAADFTIIYYLNDIHRIVHMIKEGGAKNL